jgi:hypothetical protein
VVYVLAVVVICIHFSLIDFERLRQATKEAQQELEETDATLEAIRKQLGDEENWLRARNVIKSNSL